MGTIIVFGLIVLAAAAVVIILRGNTSEQAEEQMNETVAAESQAQAKTVSVKVNSNTFETADKLYESGFYDECANNVRKICERHVDDMLYIKGIRVTTADGSLPSLKDKIDAIAENMNVPESYIRILHNIRITGNKGSHEQGGVTADEARLALYNMRTIHENLYPVMCKAKANAAQSNEQTGLTRDEKNTFGMIKFMVAFNVIGVVLFIAAFILKSYEIAPISFGMILISVVLSKIIEFKCRSEISGSKIRALISMLTDDRVNYNNSQRLQQEQIRQHMDWVQQEQIRQQNEWAMNETMKAGTPMSMGGYMPDNSFNNFNNFNNGF